MRGDERARSARGLVLLVPALLLGLLVTVQWRTQSGRTPAVTRYQVPLAEAVVDLQREQTRLKQQIADLRARLDAIQGQGATLDARAGALQHEVNALKVGAGLTAVSGSGVTVTLEDARLPAATNRKVIELAIVHSQDITDVFNAAWKARARAISVNGERITVTSACVGAVIQINGTLLSPPFVVSILGPTEELYAALSAPAELGDLKRRREAFGLGLQIARAEALEIPAYTGPLAVRHAAIP